MGDSDSDVSTGADIVERRGIDFDRIPPLFGPYLTPSPGGVTATLSSEESDTGEKGVMEERRRTESLLKLKQKLESERNRLEEENGKLEKEKKSLRRRNDDLEEEVENLVDEVRKKTCEKENKKRMLEEVTYMVQDIKAASDSIERERIDLQITIDRQESEIDRLADVRVKKESERLVMEGTVERLCRDLEEAMVRRKKVEDELEECEGCIRDVIAKRKEFEEREDKVSKDWEVKLQEEARSRYKAFREAEDKERQRRICALEQEEEEFEGEIQRLERSVRRKKEIVCDLKQQVGSSSSMHRPKGIHVDDMSSVRPKDNVKTGTSTKCKREVATSPSSSSDSSDCDNKGRLNSVSLEVKSLGKRSGATIKKENNKAPRGKDSCSSDSENENSKSRPRRSKNRRRRKVSTSSSTSDSEGSIQSNKGGKSRHQMKPQKYSGKTVFADFLSQFEACKDYNSWSSKEAAFQLFSCCQDDALNRLTTDGVNPKTTKYEHMVEVLEREFGPRECISSYLMELNQARQKQGETAREFGNRVKKLTSLAFRGKDRGSKATREDMAMNSFTLGLRRKDVRDAVFGAEYKTLKHAIDKAEYLESYHRRDEEVAGDKKRVSFARKIHVGSESESEVEDRLFERLVKKFEDGRAQVDPDRKGEKEGNIGASVRTEGMNKESESDLEVSVRALVETTRALLNNQTKPEPNRKKFDQGRARSNQVTCYGCGEVGHVRRECRKFQGPPRGRLNNFNCLNCMEQGHGWRDCPYQASCFTCHSTDHWSRDCAMNAQGNGRGPSRGPQGRPQYQRGQDHMRSQSYSRAASPTLQSQ